MDKTDRLGAWASQFDLTTYVRYSQNPPNSHGINGYADFDRKMAFVEVWLQMTEDAVAYALCHELGHFFVYEPECPDLHAIEAMAWDYADSIWFQCFGTHAPEMPALVRVRRDALKSYEKVRH